MFGKVRSLGRGDLLRVRPAAQGRGDRRLLSQMSRSHADSCVSVPSACGQTRAFLSCGLGVARACGAAAPHESKGLRPVLHCSGPRDALAPVWAAPSATCTAQPRTSWTPPQVGAAGRTSDRPARGRAVWESCPPGAFGGCFRIFLRSVFVIYSMICECQPQNTLGSWCPASR